MSDKGSVFSKGGGGTTFEISVQAAFLTTLIIRGNAPSLEANEIIEIAFQTTNRGYETDDLLVIAKSTIGQHRLLAQIKHNLTFTADNTIFKEVIKAFWKDYNDPQLFDPNRDKLVIIKNGLNKEDRNHIKSLFNWAKTHATENDFLLEVNRIKAKKERLDIFKEVLKEANNNSDLADKEIWEFLRCLDVLDYDFLNQTSVDEAYFLNLIKLSKHNNTSTTDKEIWDSILSYTSKLNKDGGSVTIESIQKEEIYANFDAQKLNPYFKSIDKLRLDGEVILKPLKNTIADFHIDKKDNKQALLSAINSSQFTIVTGKPGVGKSAEIKDVLKEQFSSASVFVFRADQFNEPHLANVFSSQGVNETIKDVFSCISLIPDKIIFLDSLEKLLEANPECAFRQFLYLLKEHPEIKVIGSSRSYAIDLIIQKFGIDKRELAIVEVLPLTEVELNLISERFPQLTNLLQNQKIRKLMQSPKYLDFAISALNKAVEDYTNVSLTEFKDKLWNYIVCDITKRSNGLPAKREKAFMEIAITRAAEMKLFVRADQADEEAIDLLESDEVLVQENLNRKYSPSHDILEDWALVKFISQKFEEFPKSNDLFKNLGSAPAIRRAFRLWINDYLIDDSTKINRLIKDALNDESIETYWIDEVLSAVFKSDNCSSFFEKFETALLENDGELLNRCIHLIKTTCKESNLRGNNLSLLLPIGSGWHELVLFIQKHISSLDTLRISISGLLDEWDYKSLFEPEINSEEKLAVKEIILHYFRQIEAGDEFWTEENYIGKAQNLISVLYHLTPIAKAEITDLLTNAFKKRKSENSWRFEVFYRSIIEKCLLGYDNQSLVKELPELIIQTAWKEWKLKIKKSDNPEDNLKAMRFDSLRSDACWGIRDKHSFFPSGIYKTPIYTLLSFHPIPAVKFITEFLNYSVDFYINANCEYKHEIKQIEIECNDGTIIKQWGAFELWVAFRGASVTHYAIESILMSLEKYLLDLVELNTDWSTNLSKLLFNYLLKNSNNVAITGVLASITMAHPQIFEEEMLPLFTAIELYDWDLNRALRESQSMAPLDNRISFAQKERSRLNQLPHRRRFNRGLRDFILDYQFKGRSINDQLHKIFDKLRAKIAPSDKIAKKLLTEIDCRKWVGEKYDKELGGIIVKPEYEEDVTEFLKSSEDYFTGLQASVEYSHAITKALEGSNAITLESWRKFYSYYLTTERDFLYDKPVSLSILGLSKFINSLSEIEKTWCIETIFNSIIEILRDTIGDNYERSGLYSLMEKEIALTSFHYLLGQVESEEDINSIIYLLIRTLIAPFAEYEFKRIESYFRTEFFKLYPSEAMRVWIGVIRHSKFARENRHFQYQKGSEAWVEFKEKENQFIHTLSLSVNLDVDVSTLNLKNCEGHLICRALMVIPHDTINDVQLRFIHHLIPLILEDIGKEEKHHDYHNPDGRNIYHETESSVQQYLAEFLLNANAQEANIVMKSLLRPVLNINKTTFRHRYRDVREFSKTTFEYVVLKLFDESQGSSQSDSYQKHLQNFWNLWEELSKLVIDSGNSFFVDLLLLNVRHLLFDYAGYPTEIDWIALTGKSEFYENLVRKLGSGNTKAIVNIFSTIGAGEFLPNGINWLVEIFKANPSDISSLSSPAAERMIRKLYYRYISEIKGNKNLIDDFIWILDKMIDLGSSEAYLFRENVITYKTIS